MVPQNSMNRLRDMPRFLHVSSTDSVVAIRPSASCDFRGFATDAIVGEIRLYVICVTGRAFHHHFRCAATQPRRWRRIAALPSHPLVPSVTVRCSGAAADFLKEVFAMNALEDRNASRRSL